MNKDMWATVLHEYVEFHIMESGTSYDTAHDAANKIETKFRKTGQSSLQAVKDFLEEHSDFAKSELAAAKASRLQKDDIALWVAGVSRKLIKHGAEGNASDEGMEGVSDVAASMMGYDPRLLACFEAVRFLTGGKELSPEEIRAALYEHDDDAEVAALHAYGLPETEENFSALRACIDIGKMKKAEAEEPPMPEGKDVKAGVFEARDTADEIERAFKDNGVQPIKLGGKHSKGTLIARDPQTHNVYLLKPGFAGPGPAAGVTEEKATQSQREACFYHVAEAWGLEASLPQCDLVVIDGKMYAAMRMLPFSYKNLDSKAQTDPGLPARALESYRNRGILHKWAILDFVLGQPDRHGQNLMISEDDKVVALIDEGSAFAGEDFNPAHDKNSFVPFYLRAWGPRKFNSLSVNDKMRRMPQVSDPVRRELSDWLDGIHADQLNSILMRYGIDPRPSLMRLAKIKMLAGDMPLDQAINKLWITV